MPGLSVIRAGPAVAFPADALAGTGSVFSPESGGQEFDYRDLDTPPVLAVPDRHHGSRNRWTAFILLFG